MLHLAPSSSGARPLLAVLCCLLGPAVAGSTMASTWEVNASLAACDDATGGPFCSLGAALRAAQKSGRAATVILADGGTYSLAQADHQDEGGNGLPAITSEVTILGNGGVVERSDRPGIEEFRIFRVDTTGSLHLEDLVIRNGATSHGFDGAGLWNRGTLVLTRCRVTGNSSLDDGGGIRNDGRLRVIDSTVDRNRAQGRGGVGGGLYNVSTQGDGIARIEGSTFSENSADASGGAVWNESELTAINTTFSGNRATDHAGGIQNLGTATLHHCTVADNRAGQTAGGIRAYMPVFLSHSILSGNTAPVGHGCHGRLASRGYNLVSTPDRCTLEDFGDTDLVGVDPQLSVLEDNGGPTTTHSLHPSSPAVDAGPPALDTALDAEGLQAGRSETGDQRGQSRPVDGDGDGVPRCDLGAYELTGEPGS